MPELTEAEMDLNKGYAQLLKDVSDELFHPTRTHEANVKYALRRMAAIFAKQAKENAEISNSQLAILTGIKSLADQQQTANTLAQKEINSLNRWMLILTFLGAVFALFSLILSYEVAKGHIAPDFKPPAAAVSKSDIGK